MANHTTWTGEQQATLEEMARGGYSSGMVARKIGKSRNAVIGRARRKGVSWARRRSPDHKAVPSRVLWTENDLMALKSMARMGPDAIALELGRTRAAVVIKASGAGIKLRRL